MTAITVTWLQTPVRYVSQTATVTCPHSGHLITATCLKLSQLPVLTVAI